MPIVQTNPQAELNEFYPPPYQFLRPRLTLRRKPQGMGQTPGQLASTGISLATTGASAGAAIAGASSGALIGGLTIGMAIPIFGAIAGVLAGILANVFKGCGQSCILTSDAANQLEQTLQQNVNAYFASPRTAADQAAALSNFDTTWAQLQQYCGQASMGQAGQNCISDRDASSCAYKTSGCSLSAATPPVWSCGANGSGSQCWNWFVGYRDPIANDSMPTQLAAQGTIGNGTSSNATGATPASIGAPTTTFDFSSLLLPGALILGGILLFAGGD